MSGKEKSLDRLDSSYLMQNFVFLRELYSSSILYIIYTYIAIPKSNNIFVETYVDIESTKVDRMKNKLLILQYKYLLILIIKF